MMSAELTTAPSARTSLQQEPALDELMMAMDVVDTLRHQEKIALDALDQDGKDKLLKERLRNLYESQGLSVSEEILDEGIRALKEDRFTYHPRASGLFRIVASLWINRRKYILAVSSVLAVLFLLAGVSLYSNYRHMIQQNELRVELSETLPRQLAQVVKRARHAAIDPDAFPIITAFQQQGEAAIIQQNVPKTKEAIQALQSTYQDLTQIYELRIVSEPGSLSAVYRSPNSNRNQRNYYLIVEAIAPGGTPIPMNVLNEETNKKKTVTRWGQRVPFETYEMVRRDKQDDGIIQKNIIASKGSGYLKPDFVVPVQIGAITEW